MTDRTRELAFQLDAREVAEAEHFVDTHVCRLRGVRTAIGGKLTYEFSPTSVGIVKTVKCACGAEHDLTDYDSW